jgi:hypothetical protein
MSKYRRSISKPIRISGFVTLLLLTSSSIFAQGLNNTLTIDSADVQNALRCLGIEMYKFPISVPDPAKRYIVNTITEEYRNGKLVSHHDEYRYLLARFKDTATVEAISPILDSATHDEFFRVYTQSAAGSMKFNTFIINVQNSSAMKPPRSGWTVDTRAMNYFGVSTVPTPLVVYYGQPRSKGLMYCPGDRSVADIRHDYGYAAILYAQLIELPK